MALLLFRIIIVLAIGFFPINGTEPGVAFIVNEDGPEPRLKFNLEPPSCALVTKNAPLHLPCSVNVTDESKVTTDYYDDNYDEEDEDEDGDNDEEEQEDDDGGYDGQYAKKLSDLKSVEDHHDDGITGVYSRSRRHALGRRQSGLNKKNHLQHNLQYTWYYNGVNISSLAVQNYYLIFPNGTLKIQYNENVGGYYRCIVNDTKLVLGALVSRETVVTVAFFQRDSSLPNATVIDSEIGYPFVLNCPLSSTPPANITWFYYKKQIFLNDLKTETYEKDKRFYQLQNGSLLITNLRGSDSGKYKCIAKNDFLKKSQRTYYPTVNVIPNKIGSINDGLFPSLQNNTIRLVAGSILKIYCVGYKEAVHWTYTPRLSTIPIKLSNVTFEIKYFNISKEKHDGIYNCSVPNDFQLYDVTIITPPVFQQTFKSIKTSIAASVSLNCNVSGSPMPNITWYRNGKLLKNNFIINFDYPTLKLNTLEPENEGIYQCFAKNEAGEIHTEGYLTFRNKQNHRNLPKRPENVNCYPINYSTLLVTFETQENYHMVNYYLATREPYTWTSVLPIFLHTNKSIIINNNLTPLKMYTLYIRGLVKEDDQFINEHLRADKTHLKITRLSKGIKCATQGLRIYSISYGNGIFLWWPNSKENNPKYYTIQLRHDNIKNETLFQNEVIGSYNIFDKYQTLQEIEPHLRKISIKTNISHDLTNRKRRSFDLISATTRQIFDSLESEKFNKKIINNVDDDDDDKDIKKDLISNFKNADSENNSNKIITELYVPGNVTGILIPNVNRIDVRVLGSFNDNGKFFYGNLRFVQWKTIDWSSKNSSKRLSHLRLTNTESRSISFTWTGYLIDKQCINICYKNVNQDIQIRGGLRIECQNIIPSNNGITTLRHLLPFTVYKLFLQYCNSDELLSEVLEVQTKQDVSGPVTHHKIIKDDGITLVWGPPMNPNGHILYYSIKWLKLNETYTYNCSINENSFKFPNTTLDDKLNISIRAVGEYGIGIPIYVNLSGQNGNVDYGDSLEQDTPVLGIILGVILSIMCVLVFLWIIIRYRKRLKPRQHIISNAAPNRQQQIAIEAYNTDIHEMQTLISRPEKLIPNGKNKNLDNNFNSDTADINNDQKATNSEKEYKLLPPVLIKKESHVEYDTLVADIENVNDDNKARICNDNTNNTQTAVNTLSINEIPYQNGIIAKHPLKEQLEHISQTYTCMEQQPKIGQKTNTNTNGNLRITENPQYLTDPNINTSLFDNIEQILILDNTLDYISVNSNSSGNLSIIQNDENNLIIEDNIPKQQQQQLQEKTSSSWNYRLPIVGPNG